MPSKVVVGVQWGDEGKGKVIDILASRADVVVRSQGGNNAGHTVKSGGEVYKLHLIPSGILYKGVKCYIGCGVVIDPQDLLREIDGLAERGVDCSNLRIDPRAHIIMPWHRKLDGLSEKALGGGKIGTTGRGIGPCYMDKYERSGIRMYDLVHDEVFTRKAKAVGQLKNEIITKIYGGDPLDVDAVIGEYLEYAKRLAPYVEDVSVLTDQAVREGKNILFEGAQATLLDIDFGTYPYVTSSHPVSGGAAIGAGVGPNRLGEIIGVAKAYTTRVGEGPFPTELFDGTGDLIRNRGQEFGTTTGRPRRTGWFDAVLIRHAVRVNGLDCLAVNKFDTLSGLETLKVCVAYQKPDGTVLTEYPCDIHELEGAAPVYEEVKGFSDDISGCKTFDELPQACKAYIERLEELCGCPIKMVGVGPSREQVLER
ncbi:MAG: adenylosuccinate synthase [Oscillospiraceae bacterium]|nr:adenylosuccinate synthase [Oscillospiraceae bacterium]